MSQQMSLEQYKKKVKENLIGKLRKGYTKLVRETK